MSRALKALSAFIAGVWTQVLAQWLEAWLYGG